jgi:hypothetical protein
MSPLAGPDPTGEPLDHVRADRPLPRKIGRPPITSGARPVSVMLEGLLHRDFNQVALSVAPDVRFRALVPSGVRKADSAEAATNWLRTWFEAAEAFMVLDSGIEAFGGRHRFWYRFGLEREGRSTVIDQEGFCDVRADQISDIAIVCSGFRPTPQGPG